MSVRVPAPVFAPKDLAELSAILAEANRDGQPVIPVGTKGFDPARSSAFGSDPSRTEQEGSDPLIGATRTAPALLSLEHLNAPIDHRAGDLTATLPAGAVLAEVNAVLARGGQWLPLDPAFSDRQTIGAIVATNDSGPRRHRHGAPRDLIIGIELALADGRLAKAGGHVVKNVAGYDLARMMCGSFGSLAVITSATFKLAPLAPDSRTVVADVPDLQALAFLLAEINSAPIAPSAVEITWPPCRLLVRFETTAIAGAQQSTAACALAEARGARTAVLTGDAEKSMWTSVEDRTFHHAGTLLKVSMLPTNVAPLLETVDRLAMRTDVTYHVGGRAGLGVLYVRLEDPASRHAEVIAGLRQQASARGGSAVIVRAESEVLRTVDRWGDMGDTRSIQQAVKQQFDPKGILNPGGGPGGL